MVWIPIRTQASSASLPSCCRSRVDASMSEKSNVTLPVGGNLLTSAAGDSVQVEQNGAPAFEPDKAAFLLVTKDAVDRRAARADELGGLLLGEPDLHAA